MTPLQHLDMTGFSYETGSQSLVFYEGGTVHGTLQLGGEVLPKLSAMDLIDLGWAIKNALIAIYTERENALPTPDPRPGE